MKSLPITSHTPRATTSLTPSARMRCTHTLHALRSRNSSAGGSLAAPCRPRRPLAHPTPRRSRRPAVTSLFREAESKAAQEGCVCPPLSLSIYLSLSLSPSLPLSLSLSLRARAGRRSGPLSSLFLSLSPLCLSDLLCLSVYPPSLSPPYHPPSLLLSFSGSLSL
jgi:hypothetical protein